MVSQSLSDKIRDLVDAHWAKTQRALLLSELGIGLQHDAEWRRIFAEGTTLLRYIEENLSNQLTILRHPDRHLVVGLVPKSADIDQANLQSLFVSRAVAEVPRYAKAFWAAFLVPLTSDRRFFDPRYISFKDRANDDSKDIDASLIEVDSKFIVPPDDPDRTTKIHASIEKWANEKGIDVSKFVERGAPARAADLAGKRSVLDLVLDTIDAKDMERIQIPLSVIDKLRLRKV